MSRAAARQASQQVGHMNTSLKGRQEEEGVRGGVEDHRNTNQDSENVSYKGKEGNKCRCSVRKNNKEIMIMTRMKIMLMMKENHPRR